MFCMATCVHLEYHCRRSISLKCIKESKFHSGMLYAGMR
jgi:hypothetical protein